MINILKSLINQKYSLKWKILILYEKIQKEIMKIYYKIKIYKKYKYIIIIIILKNRIVIVKKVYVDKNNVNVF